MDNTLASFDCFIDNVNSALKGDIPVFTTGEGTLVASDRTVCAEYISAGQEQVRFELFVCTTSGQELFSEEIIFRPFESITCAFVGENEQAGDPILSPDVTTGSFKNCSMDTMFMPGTMGMIKYLFRLTVIMQEGVMH